MAANLLLLRKAWNSRRDDQVGHSAAFDAFFYLVSHSVTIPDDSAVIQALVLCMPGLTTPRINLTPG